MKYGPDPELEKQADEILAGEDIAVNTKCWRTYGLEVPEPHSVQRRPGTHYQTNEWDEWVSYDEVDPDDVEPAAWVDDVTAALDELSPLERAVFQARQNSLTRPLQDIADELGVTKGQVRHALERAQKVLADVVPDEIKEKFGMSVNKPAAPLTKRQKALKLSVVLFPESAVAAAEAYMGGLPIDEIAHAVRGEKHGQEWWDTFKAECWRIDAERKSA